MCEARQSKQPRRGPGVGFSGSLCVACSSRSRQSQARARRTPQRLVPPKSAGTNSPRGPASPFLREGFRSREGFGLRPRLTRSDGNLMGSRAPTGTRLSPGDPRDDPASSPSGIRRVRSSSRGRLGTHNTGANLQPGPIEYVEVPAEDRRCPTDVRSTSVETNSTGPGCQVQRLVMPRHVIVRSHEYPSERRRRAPMTSLGPSETNPDQIRQNRYSVGTPRPARAAQEFRALGWVGGVPSPAADQSPAWNSPKGLSPNGPRPRLKPYKTTAPTGHAHPWA